MFLQYLPSEDLDTQDDPGGGWIVNSRRKDDEGWTAAVGTHTSGRHVPPERGGVVTRSSGELRKVVIRGGQGRTEEERRDHSDIGWVRRRRG